MYISEKFKVFELPCLDQPSVEFLKFTQIKQMNIADKM